MTEDNQSPEIIEESPEIDDTEQLDESQPTTGEMTITLRRWQLYVFVMPLIFIIGLGLGFLGRGWVQPLSETSTVAASSSDSASVGAQSDPQTPAETQQVVRYDSPGDDDPMLGSDSAPVTMMEFSN